ncbi:MAG: hypothetical protein B6D44_02125 [Ignavibacteriales bacterium UTCHB2]|jgi:SAM-dependent methyltransferase|nr:MAG: hypothetical protein B6D44_02125 [Ignavibacteriales bacterium UTCHB2]HQI41282.1 hypothetical protein [Ignavibacteriaceae bacterium]
MVQNNILIYFLRNKKIYHSPSSLIWYYKYFLFNGIDFTNKSFLDIGGGIGLASFYALINNSERVVLIEPEDAGSGSFKMDNFYKLEEYFHSYSERITLRKELFQDFNELSENYDIKFLHNSINHLDEDACISLTLNDRSRLKYIELFEKLYTLLKQDGQIIITDCSNRNLFNDIGIKNILAPQIEWQKHKKPETWIELMREVGFKEFKIQWTSLKQFRKLGRILFGNKLIAYLTFSHFKLSARKF